MIQTISLKFGATADAGALTFTVAPVTVFVGPNNAGKSKILVEIEQICRTATNIVVNHALIARLEFTPLTKDEIEAELAELVQEPSVGEILNAEHILIGRLHPQNNQAWRTQVHRASVVAEAQAPNGARHHYTQIISLFTLRMDGTNRLNLLQDKATGDLKAVPTNHLAHLFQDNLLRADVRRIVYEAFNKYFVIDPTNVGTLSVRLSNRKPVSEREEKGWESESVEFHKAAIPISSASDGVRAFSGIVATILAGEPKITLIDEPEAFLHPALASKLGNEITKSVANTKKRLFVATHSASFLMGCIQAGVPLNIVRLTYNYSKPTARLLPREKLLPLMRHPLLRSTGVLQGLFYEAVVVTEGDADRAFYQEVNERLVAQSDSRGISSCLFINAQNKQTVWEIAKPLRELGIPTVCIVDIDVLKEGGTVWTKALNGAFIPSISHAAFHSQRQAILTALNASGLDMKKNGGISLLSGAEKEAAENLLSQLAAYGLFIVPGGELESWLKWLNVTGHTPEWLIEMFEKMGDDPSKADYVQPSQDDVWNFFGGIARWIADPSRRGIPT